MPEPRHLALVCLLLALAIAGPWIAPYDPAELIDPVAGRLLPPLSSREAIVLDDGRRLLAESVERHGEVLQVVRRGEPERIPTTRVERRERRFYLLGTDKYGRDLFSRILHGARISLSLGLLASALALGLGTLVGATAALGGRWLDGTLMRLTDAFLAFPRLFLLLAAGALFRPGAGTLVLVLGATGWMGAARLARAEIRSLRQQDFVLAAEASGLSTGRVLRRHLLPNALAPLIVEGTLRVGDLILVEAALSFLGLGIQPPDPSWGNMIADAGTTLPAGAWAALWPGLALAGTVIVLNLLGDELRDRLDPRSAP